MEAHFEFMPDNYFRAFDVGGNRFAPEALPAFPGKLVFATMNRPLAPAIAWEAFPEQGHSIASFCAWDGQELLAKIAGSFAVVPINILSADIYTRGDNVVLDIFRVCDTKFRAVTDKRDLALVETTLRSALADENFDFAPLLDQARRKARQAASRGEMDFPTRVTVENKTHPTYTLIQIQTPDRLGLLYELLSAFGEERVSIALSRISTEKGAAIDTFYVADRATRGKITDPARIAALQERLHRAASASASRAELQITLARDSFPPNLSISAMNALILAAGYATRLYPLTLNKAKPLLEVAGKPMIEWVLDNLAPVPDLETVYVVTNNKFVKDFQSWAEGYRQRRRRSSRLKIINDGSTDDSDKLGAIGDINLVLTREDIWRRTT